MALRIRLLGAPEIEIDAHVVPLGGKPLALLAYLFVTGQPQTRHHLMDLLSEEAADPRASLRWTLNKVRQTIGSQHLWSDRQQIGFNRTSAYWCDVEAFTAGQTDLYRGELLEGLYLTEGHRFMDWLFLERERLRGQYQTALTGQLEAAEQRGEYATMVTVGHQLLGLDNLREDWYRAVMRAYAGLGQRGAALEQFQLYRRVLARELHLEPEPQTLELAQQIEAGELLPRSFEPRAVPLAIPAPRLEFPFPPYLAAEANHTNLSPVFVAREQALTRLDGFLETALSGRGQVAFVTGDPGQGKTATVMEFARRATAAHPDLLVLLGQCNAYAGLGDPYLPFLDMLGMLTGDLEGRLTAGTLTRPQARRLWAAFPSAVQALLDYGVDLMHVWIPLDGLCARLEQAMPGQGQALRQRLQPQLRVNPELTPQFLFQQFTNVLKALAGHHPLLLILDDLQWVDLASISVLFHLAKRIGDSPILLVGTYRPEEVAVGRAGVRHPLEAVLAELQRSFGEVEVDLAQELEGGMFVAAFLDSEPNELGEGFRQALFQHTGGHPLFTIELLRALRERGALTQNKAGKWVKTRALAWNRLPARVEAVIAERIGRLEPELQQMLAVGSVEGETFTAQVVARVQNLNERQVLSQLSQVGAHKHRLVQPQGEIPLNGGPALSRYRFNHFLFHQYLYEGLDPGERRLLHQEVGHVLLMFA